MLCPAAYLENFVRGIVVTTADGMWYYGVKGGLFAWFRSEIGFISKNCGTLALRKNLD